MANELGFIDPTEAGNAAVYQFRSQGMDGHRYIELPHPISNLKPEEMRAVTLRFVDQLVRQLTA